jgi:hypothetical protein
MIIITAKATQNTNARNQPAVLPTALSTVLSMVLPTVLPTAVAAGIIGVEMGSLFIIFVHVIF